MTKQEQIEEMWKSIPQTIIAYDMNPKGQHLYGEQRKCIAEALYDAGYRKADDVRKETAREILGMLYDLGIDKNTIEYCGIYDVNGAVLAKRISSKYGVEVEE